MKRNMVRMVGLMAVAWSAAGAQEGGRITGHVLDGADKVPLSAAQVLVSGTTIGTITNDSGTFNLRVPADGKSLTVRRIGYRQSIIPLVAGQADYTVSLDRDVLRLEQQVITGVATTVSSKNAANAVAVVSAAAVNEVPAPTMENAIQGKVPGALIASNNGGAPGGGLQIQVRGVTSINGNASPLYVIDGVIVNNETVNPDANAISQSGGGTTSTGQAASAAPSREDNGVNRIADINPEDIESIEVLKGASASAIYGSKASAGVIVITTKKGTAGKPRWDFNSQLGHFSLENTLPIRSFPTLGSAQLWYITDIKGKDAATPAATADSAFIKTVYAGPQDYQSQLFGNPQLSYSSNLSVSGTAGQTQYFVSGLTKYDNGIQDNTGYNKQSIRANVTQEFSSNFHVSANLNYIHDVTRRGITGNDNIGISPYNVLSTTPQFVSLNHQAANGTWPINPFGSANPFADAEEIATPEALSRFIGGGNVNWDLFKTEHQTLNFTAIGGADVANYTSLLFAPTDLQVEQLIPNGLVGTSVTNSASIQYFNYSLNLSHHYTGLSFMDMTTTAGFTRDRRSLTNPVTVGQNLLAGVNSPTVGTVQQNFYQHTQQLDQSFYGQEQLLLLDQRLALTGGVTAERSTNDGNIGRFYAYPRGSASFRIPQIASFVDELKLRFAYGQSGNLPLYGAKYTPFNPSQISGLGGISGNPNHGDPTITPEQETEMETGFDLTFFKSRAQFSATVYQKQLSNLILQASVAPSLGFATQFFNGGQFTNQGIELQLQATPIQTRSGFAWTSNITYSRNYSVVNSLPTAPGPIGNTFGFGNAFLAPGRSVSELVNPNILGKDNLPIQVGDFQPTFRMDFEEAISFGPLRASGQMEWSKGGSTINLTNLYFDGGPQLWADSAASTNRLNAFVNGLTPYVQDATFLKLRNVSLSYTLPKVTYGWAHGKIASAKLIASGYNLFSWFKFPGLDPEVSVNGNQTVTRGQDITPYPPARSYFLGIDLGL